MRSVSFLFTSLLTMVLALSCKSFCHPRISRTTALKAIKSKKSMLNWGEVTGLVKKYQQLTEPSASPQSETASGNGRSFSLTAQFGEKVPKINPLLVLPLSRRPIFPGFLATHLVKDEKTLDAIIENAKNGISYVGMFLQKDKGGGDDVRGGQVISSLDQVHKTGTYAQIHNVVKTARGGQLLLMAHRRIRLEELVKSPDVDDNEIDCKSDSNAREPSPAMGRVTFLESPPSDPQSTTLKAYTNEIVAAVQDLVKLNPMAQEHIHEWASRMDFSDPLKLADFAASITSAEGEDLQRVLSATDPAGRLSATLQLLNKEKQIAEFQKDISQQVEEKMSNQQREFILRQQLKTINKELGIDKDDRSVQVTKYQSKVDALQLRTRAGTGGAPVATLAIMQEEVDKLASLERTSPEYHVVRSYLDWLTSMPYDTFTRDELDLQRATAVLDSDHLGLEGVKEQILEFIAVGKLKDQLGGMKKVERKSENGSGDDVKDNEGVDEVGMGTELDASRSITSKILCLIGPPGVGKTSVAKSIASALNRKFHRFSVGGLTDMAEIKGHRRTYIGAMPGKPVQILRSLGTCNPVILIDEIDKLGRGHQGDPASALLELLDASQNNSFVDHFLDVPVDFSNTLFVCTANDEAAIPSPLRDRMDIIRLSGYDIREKVGIARQYLVPKIFRKMGLTRGDGEGLGPRVVEEVRTSGSSMGGDNDIRASISDSALEELIRNYCRESGIRSLEQHLEKIARKIAFKEVTRREQIASEGREREREIGEAVSDQDYAISFKQDALPTYHIIPESLEEYLGPPKYPQEALYSQEQGGLPPGVVMGLAWSPQGGTPVFVEAAATPVAFTDTGGSVQMVTGQLGSVMKESVDIAYTYARQFMRERYPENVFFKTHQLHLHCPEGAVGKDGPSAGISIATALISLATQTSVSPQLAMTGEISLTGKVLPVGGIKEKILAARRTGASRVVLPTSCRRDFQDLPAYVQESVEVHFASCYEDVFRVAFNNSDADASVSVPHIDDTKPTAASESAAMMSS